MFSPNDYETPGSNSTGAKLSLSLQHKNYPETHLSCRNIKYMVPNIKLLIYIERDRDILTDIVNIKIPMLSDELDVNSRQLVF